MIRKKKNHKIDVRKKKITSLILEVIPIISAITFLSKFLLPTKSLSYLLPCLQTSFLKLCWLSALFLLLPLKICPAQNQLNKNCNGSTEQSQLCQQHPDPVALCASGLRGGLGARDSSQPHSTVLLGAPRFWEDEGLHRARNGLATPAPPSPPPQSGLHCGFSDSSSELLLRVCTLVSLTLPPSFPPSL